MKLSALSLVFFLSAAPAPGFAADASLSGQKSPAGTLRFEKMPLGNVVRILSARFSTPVTIAANARAPITGDFSAMDLPRALGAASRQAGLIVVPLGPVASAGFALEPPPAVPTGGTREALLKKRADLLEQAARLPH